MSFPVLAGFTQLRHTLFALRAAYNLATYAALLAKQSEHLALPGNGLASHEPHSPCALRLARRLASISRASSAQSTHAFCPAFGVCYTVCNALAQGAWLDAVFGIRCLTSFVVSFLV